MSCEPSRSRPIDRRPCCSEPDRQRRLRRYAAEHSASDLDALVRSYRPLACSLARRYARGPQGDPDLEQAACEGLVKALQRFDPGRGTPFTSFAVPTILGEIRRYVRDTAWPAHVPRQVQERVRAIRVLAERHSADHGRLPSVAELASTLACSDEAVVDALSAATTSRTVSLEAERDDEEGLALVDRLGAEDPGYEQVDCLTDIGRVFGLLPEDEQRVIELHFRDDLTQRQIAARLGFSRSHVGRLLGSGLDRLRETAAA
jgi:RNA polymerase sigma-B factor